MRCTIVLEPTRPQIELNIEEINSTYAYYYSPSFVFNGESHAAWEFIYVNFGEVVVQTPKYENVLKKGQAFIHVPGEFHKIRANNVACNVYVISFNCSCKKLYAVAKKIIDLSPPQKQYLSYIISEGQVYLAGKNDIPKSEKKPGFAGGQIIKNLIELLFIELIRQNAEEQNCAKEKKSDGQKADISLAQKSLVEYIINYLHQNLHRKLKLEDIASYAGYSIPHICTVFKKAVGTTIVNYLINLRINKAKQLIADGKMSLRQISEHLDFDSIQYFSSQFKKVTGIMPSQYLAHLKMNKYKYDNAINLEIL